MPKVEIITRCFNRLEYTAMCIRGIQKNTGFDDYKHILVNQNSSDGTKEWLESIKEEGFYKIKVKHNNINTGDAGGMLDGFNMISDDCEYVMQFDNDCVPITENFLKKLVDIMDSQPHIGAIMMKRTGVKNVLEVTDKITIGEVTLGKLNVGTCCMIMRRKDLEKFNHWRSGEKIGWGVAISQLIKQSGREVMKALNVKVHHIDGPSSQQIKYPKYFKNTIEGSNYKYLNYKQK